MPSEMKDLVVIKFGTASITKTDGTVNEQIIDEIADQVAGLTEKYRILLVSSGAVGTGKSFIPNYKGDITQRKAAAAIGNPILIGMYSKAFGKHKIPVAQSLCERGHFSDRSRFLQLKQTFETLWKSGVIPIANENDVVSDLELRFSDNDELATLLAAGFGAKWLMFCTSVGGLLNKDGNLIHHIAKIDQQVLAMANPSKSSLGLGGMISKLSFAKRAVTLGIGVIIFGHENGMGILNALEGKTGTRFDAKQAHVSAKLKWLSSGSLIVGKILVDEGAAAAVKSRKSLLAVGVASIEGEFDKGEVIEIYSSMHEPIAVAKASQSSEYLQQHQKSANLEVAHADFIVLL